MAFLTWHKDAFVNVQHGQWQGQHLLQIINASVEMNLLKYEPIFYILYLGRHGLVQLPMKIQGFNFFKCWNILAWFLYKNLHISATCLLTLFVFLQNNIGVTWCWSISLVFFIHVTFYPFMKKTSTSFAVPVVKPLKISTQNNSKVPSVTWRNYWFQIIL